MNLRKRIAVFLCLLLTVPAMMQALPQAKLEVQAATTVSVSWQGLSGSGEERDIQISTKTKGFYMGDYLYAYSYGDGYKKYGALSMNSGVKYKSSNTSVAAINSTTGLVTPKKKGSTKITIKFKGVSKTCTLNVVSNLGSGPAEYNKLQKSANALIKGYGKKITTSNRYKVVNLNNVYREERGVVPYISGMSPNYGVESTSAYSDSTWVYANKAKMPALAHAYVISDKVSDYVDSVNPIGTGSAKLFKVSSVTGKGSAITAKVNGKVTVNQIFGIKASVSSIWDTCIANGNTAKFPLYVKDMTTGHKYYAIATATKGKNTLSIKLQSSTLKKNRTYKLLGISSYDIYGDWTNWGKTTFKAK